MSTRRSTGVLPQSKIITRAKESRQVREEYQKLKEQISHTTTQAFADERFDKIEARLEGAIQLFCKKFDGKTIKFSRSSDPKCEQQPSIIHIGKSVIQYLSREHQHKLRDIFNLNEAYFCDVCFKCFASYSEIKSHKVECSIEIFVIESHLIYSYHFYDIQVNAASGIEFSNYAQNLMKFTALFGNFKYQVEFVNALDFFILFRKSTKELIGYFSRDRVRKYVFCVLFVMPMFRRRGYGYLLVSLAYHIAKEEGIQSAPLSPYSDEGLFTLDKFWRFAIGNFFKENVKKEERKMPILELIKAKTSIEINKENTILNYNQVKSDSFESFSLNNGDYIQKLIQDAESIKDTCQVPFIRKCVYDENLKNFITASSQLVLKRPINFGAMKYGKSKEKKKKRGFNEDSLELSESLQKTTDNKINY